MGLIRPIMLFLRRNIRRITLFTGLILVLAGCVWCFFLLTKNPDRKLTWDEVRRIKDGMSLTEVEAIVGVPPLFSAKEPESTRFAIWAIQDVRWITAEGWISDDS